MQLCMHKYNHKEQTKWEGGGAFPFCIFIGVKKNESIDAEINRRKTGKGF